MTTTGAWPDLVTTALLGTVRRPIPVELAGARAAGAGTADPAARVLDLAAAHTAAVRAGRVPHRLQDADPVPDGLLPSAPERARRLLDEVLARPSPTPVNLWLAGCARRGYGLAPEHWTPLTQLAARSTAYNRPLLGRVLGPPGLWFLRANPQWCRLADDASALPAPRPAPPDVGEVTPEAVLCQPEAIFAAPQPWPFTLVTAALGVVAEGRLRAAGRAYAVRVGAELPLPAYPLILRAAEHALYERPAPLAERRLVRECLAACEEAAWFRIQVEAAFAEDHPTIERRDLPPLTR